MYVQYYTKKKNKNKPIRVYRKGIPQRVDNNYY